MRVVAFLAVTLLACNGESRGTGGTFVDSIGIAMRDPALWPTMSFVPTGTEIDSVPLPEIDTTWSLATPLDVSMLPPHDSASPLNLGDSTGFVFDGDFNGDDILDRVRVGVYRDTVGTEGSFLLVMTRADSTRWTRAFVAVEPGEPVFTMLLREGNDVIWAECGNCGRWRPLYWSDDHYELGPPAEPQVEP